MTNKREVTMNISVRPIRFWIVMFIMIGSLSFVQLLGCNFKHPPSKFEPGQKVKIILSGQPGIIIYCRSNQAIDEQDHQWSYDVRIVTIPVNNEIKGDAWMVFPFGGGNIESKNTKLYSLFRFKEFELEAFE